MFCAQSSLLSNSYNSLLKSSSTVVDGLISSVGTASQEKNTYPQVTKHSIQIVLGLSNLVSPHNTKLQTKTKQNTKKQNIVIKILGCLPTSAYLVSYSLTSISL